MHKNPKCKVNSKVLTCKSQVKYKQAVADRDHNQDSGNMKKKSYTEQYWVSVYSLYIQHSVCVCVCVSQGTSDQ